MTLSKINSVAASHRIPFEGIPQVYSKITRCGTVHPEGDQSVSLTNPPQKARHWGRLIKIKEKLGSEKMARVGSVIAQVSYLTFFTMKFTKLINQTKTGYFTIPGEGFTRTFKALAALNVAIDGFLFIKSAGTTAYHAVKDITARKNRKMVQSLLKYYNPETRLLISRSIKIRDKKTLTTLLAQTDSDLSRSKGQVTLDRLSEVAGMSRLGVDITFNSLLVAEGSSQVAAAALPGVGIAAAAVYTTYSALKTASQVSALNNLAKAQSATSDPLLTALSKHIKHERTLHARKHLAVGAISAANTVASAVSAATGIGAPAAFIAMGALHSALSAGTAAFNAWHERKLNKSRDNSDHLMTSGFSLETLAAHHIGVAEKAFLHRLRRGRGKELQESVTFLRHFGLAENTIKKLQLAPEAEAMKTLQSVLYQDKVNYQGLQLKQTVKTLSHISGVTAMAKRIKMGSQWLAHQLKPKSKEPKDAFNRGYSLITPSDNEPKITAGSIKPVSKPPNSFINRGRHHYGRH